MFTRLSVLREKNNYKIVINAANYFLSLNKMQNSNLKNKKWSFLKCNRQFCMICVCR